MLSLHLSKSNSVRIPDWAISLITWICRLCIGVTFIFSGFVKAVDPWGTIYKFEEYFSALGLPNIHALVVVCVFALFTLEFLVGVFMLFGCYRKSNPIVAILFMAVMLPLTLWIAIADPVKDCGCFGDALILSNWATFWKNVALTAMMIWLLKFNCRSTCIISPAFQWLAVVAGLIYIGAVSFYGYFTQPLIDFRPYKIGESVVSDDTAQTEPNYIFVYRNGDKTQEFTEEDELPNEDEGWEFVERKEIKEDGAEIAAADNSNQASPKTFRIWDLNGENDITSDVLPEEGRVLLLMIPELSRVSPASTWRINAVGKWAEDNSMDMLAVMAGSSDQIKEWEDLSMPSYPIYTADDTAIKEVVRGNPGVVFIDHGKVVWKRTLNSIDVDKLTSAGRMVKPESLLIDYHQILRNISYLYLGVMAFIVCIAMMPRIREIYLNKVNIQA